jgi:hypothetical protein
MYQLMIHNSRLKVSKNVTFILRLEKIGRIGGIAFLDKLACEAWREQKSAPVPRGAVRP